MPGGGPVSGAVEAAAAAEGVPGCAAPGGGTTCGDTNTTGAAAVGRGLAVSAPAFVADDSLPQPAPHSERERTETIAQCRVFMSACATDGRGFMKVRKNSTTSFVPGTTAWSGRNRAV